MINQKIQERDELRMMLVSIGAVDYSKDKVQSSGDGEAAFVKTLQRIDQLERAIDSQIDSYINLKDEVINRIHELQDDRFIQILFKHYVEFKRLEQVAVEMNYSYQYVVELHGYALLAFNNLLKTYILK